ncbi:MAG TPA: hypothetical protein VHW01_02325 [Polyangiaceae bacterium]|jgi:hypothetical protein|nr:hypothetical protein [Polyangiaceae bacterium]
MTQAIAPTAVSFASELAELLIQTESAQSDSANLQRDAARKDFLENAQHQVDALHEAAADVRTGAFVSAAFTVAGAACSIGSAFDQYSADDASSKLCAFGPKTTPEIASDTKWANIFGATGKGLDTLGGAMKTFVGDAAVDDDNAKAKYFETQVEKAKWLEGDASTELDKVAKLGDKILDTLQGINQDQNSANNALIGRI